MNRPPHGFSLVSVVFLLVVVASLAAFMVSIGTTQRQTSTLSILSGRALAAAESGMEWGVENVLRNDACFASPTSFSLSGGAVAGYTVVASCSATSHTEGPDAFNVFRLTATGSRGSPGAPGHVQRTIRASVTGAP